MPRIHATDLTIERSDLCVVLRDEEGNNLGILPKSLTETQVLAAVALANAWHDTGAAAGYAKSQQTIRTALGLK